METPLLVLALLSVFVFSSECIHTHRPYHMQPIKLGMEITGGNLMDHLNNTALFDQIKEDVHRHRLLVFRDQGHIPADILVSMFERFGDIFNSPYTTQTLVNHQKAPAPAVMRISNDPAEGYKGLGTTGWHIDGAYKPIPFSFLIFNSIKAPRTGSTKFVGHREVVSSMSGATLRKLDRLWTAITRTVMGKRVYETHPLLYTHPIVNESVFCTHLGYMRGVIQDYATENETTFNANEMLELKGEITHEIEKDNERLVYAHEWREGDLVIIDNQQIMHLASKESQLPKEKVGLRVLHRIAIHGVQRPMKTSHVLFS